MEQPDVLGLVLSDALRELERLGIQYVVTETRPPDRAVSGSQMRVVRQSLDDDGIVRLLVSPVSPEYLPEER